jgi:hypothetical protein
VKELSPLENTENFCKMSVSEVPRVEAGQANMPLPKLQPIHHGLGSSGVTQHSNLIIEIRANKSKAICGKNFIFMLFQIKFLL